MVSDGQAEVTNIHAAVIPELALKASALIRDMDPQARPPLRCVVSCNFVLLYSDHAQASFMSESSEALEGNMQMRRCLQI